MGNSHSPLEVAIIGAGYVGLSTAAAFALAGHRVRLVERDPQRLSVLLEGRAPFSEPELETALTMGAAGLSFTSSLEEAVAHSDIVVMAVGTPPTPAHGADLSQLFEATQALAVHLGEERRVIAIKSTVPVGTSTEVAATLHRLNPGARVAVVSNPEFLRQGRAMRDAVFPDRIVLGATEDWALERMRALYAPIRRADLVVPAALEPYRPMAPIPLLEISPASAELAKYAANAFLAMKVSFINEIANVCDATEADVEDVVSVLSLDRRIGGDFLRPGLGYGGSCFPKDTRALSQIAARSGYEFRLLRAVIEVNAAQRFLVLDRLERALGGFRGRTVGVLGLTFKPETDDLRESIGIEIALELHARGALVRAHDPVAAGSARAQIGGRVCLADDLESCLAGADAAVLVTEWEIYRAADWDRLGSRMRRRLILDGRNALGAFAMRRAGFEYIGVGRR